VGLQVAPRANTQAVAAKHPPHFPQKDLTVYANILIAEREKDSCPPSHKKPFSSLLLDLLQRSSGWRKLDQPTATSESAGPDRPSSRGELA